MICPRLGESGHGYVGITHRFDFEDPSFVYDSAAPVHAAPAPVAASAPVPKKPTYRVLEDPFEAEAAAAPPPPPKVVLGSHPQAAEVLEGAREKFDKFWGAGPNNKPAGGEH